MKKLIIISIFGTILYSLIALQERVIVVASDIRYIKGTICISLADKTSMEAIKTFSMQSITLPLIGNSIKIYLSKIK